jgi:sec-independent protein translocase protein TatA
MGIVEIGLIVVVVILLFGAKRLPEIGKGLGQGIKEFRRGTNKNDDLTVGDTTVTVVKPEDRR